MRISPECFSCSARTSWIGREFLAGRATITLKLPVSLQIVLRALIEEGLKRDGDRNLLVNVEGQAKAIRHIRSTARHGGRAEA